LPIAWVALGHGFHTTYGGWLSWILASHLIEVVWLSQPVCNGHPIFLALVSMAAHICNLVRSRCFHVCYLLIRVSVCKSQLRSPYVVIHAKRWKFDLCSFIHRFIHVCVQFLAEKEASLFCSGFRLPVFL
jgi:hypothetical protein